MKAFWLSWLFVIGGAFAQDQESTPPLSTLPMPSKKFVVIFRIFDTDNNSRKLVQGVEPTIELRVLTHADSEGDAITKGLLISQRYMQLADWDKLKFFEACEKGK